jgi:cysteine-rich repeat protein
MTRWLRSPLFLVLASVLACAGCKDDPVPAPSCGDGVVQGEEACDFGAANSDTEPGACRNDCTEPACGDAVVDPGEECDDANPWGGDGCTPGCLAEAGTLEIEENDAPESAQPLDLPAIVHGSLRRDDRDCFAVTVPEAGALLAGILPDSEDERCSVEVVTELYDESGDRRLFSMPDLDTACSSLNPYVDTETRYLDGGSYAVCISGVFGEVLPSYTLRVEAFDSCVDLPPLVPSPSQDLDGDQSADVCDPDDDGDGVDDAVDNCPRVPNGPQQPFAWDSSYEGIVTLYLVMSPVTEGGSPNNCEPTAGSYAAVSDADAAPVLGDAYQGRSWFAHASRPGGPRVVWFTDYPHPGAPREAYAMSWVYSPDQRAGRILLGADDGFRLWLNGVEIWSASSCQGVNLDEFGEDVILLAGWNRLLVKVYDQGGGWGLATRFVWPDDSWMTDLEFSIGGPASWTDDQGDMDGDGIGDMCDVDPLNP